VGFSRDMVFPLLFSILGSLMTVSMKRTACPAVLGQPTDKIMAATTTGYGQGKAGWGYGVGRAGFSYTG
jgi:hypothetical protein